MRKTQINLARLSSYFETNPERVFTISDLESIYLEHRTEWSLPRGMTLDTFLAFLLANAGMKELRLRSTKYPALARYTRADNVSPISVALSIKKNAYFSHSSAMWVHSLGGDSKDVFINKEQSEKEANSSELSQEAIHRAFRSKQRRSNLVYEYRDFTITVLNGKHTGRLGIESRLAPSGHQVDATSLERTLIDITVRPLYAGGVPAVLRAFKNARNRVSVTKLFELLRRLVYTYPYHQSIGFYLQRAEYTKAEQLIAKAEKQNFDFYLCHEMKDPLFDPEWRIFFPRALNG